VVEALEVILLDEHAFGLWVLSIVNADRIVQEELVAPALAALVSQSNTGYTIVSLVLASTAFSTTIRARNSDFLCLQDNFSKGSVEVTVKDPP